MVATTRFVSRRAAPVLEVRAGVHTGKIEAIDGKVGGIAVHIGARIGSLAGPSEVLASSTVKDLTAGSGLVFEDAGEHELKGVPDRWRLYRVAGAASASTNTMADAVTSQRVSRPAER